MPVALLMPVSAGGGEWRGQMPLTAALRYARGRGNSRWHRIRSGIQWPTGRVSLNYWCGMQGGDDPDRDALLTADELAVNEPACGTCVGRALGAGQDEVPVDLPALRFDPRWQVPPRNCPGSRSRSLWVAVTPDERIGRCIACNEVVRILTVGRGYNAWGAGPVIHDPGPGLVAPCPFHGWHRLTVRDGQPACFCGWPYVLERP